MLSVYDKATRLVNFATGESYGDGYMVTSVIVGYAEPGYGNDESVIVLGDWNPRRVNGIEDYWHSDDPDVTLPVRLARSLERVGAEIQWCDEWTSCNGCLKAIRTTADSYSWRPAFAWTDDGIYCHTCMADAGIDGLEDYINDPHKCVTWCEPSHVESLGFVKWEPGEEHTYENGWHPGQTDDPEAILSEIVERYAAASKDTPRVLFFLDESSQFYIRFSAYVLDASDEDN